MIGLPDNLITFTNEEIEVIITENKLYAWLINHSESNIYWDISRNGKYCFELRYPEEGKSNYTYAGYVSFNGAVWISVPHDGKVEGHAEFADAVERIEKLKK